MKCNTALTPTALAVLGLMAASANAQTAAPAEPQKIDTIVVTGSRIKAANLTSTSPVSQLTQEEIALSRSVTVEDFSVKLPQLAGGVSSTSVGSDALGAQTLDLRNLGQNRTLVLINGTRAVPFSFRNAVDVNFIPAPLLRRVDVLTGGAAAVYGADAMSGVVNFVINDQFRGLQVSGNARTASGGAGQTGVNVTGGWALGNSGSVVGYAEFTDREKLLAGERSWALLNPLRIAANRGTYTDVASGRVFSVADDGSIANTAQTTDYTAKYLLTQPLKRTNLSLFGKYSITDDTQVYGRVMYSNVKTQGASRSGQAPVVADQVLAINQNNTFLPAAIRSGLTFNNGVAQVRMVRSLGELGVVTADNDRTTHQVQLGIKGSLSPSLDWDVYVQSGATKESVDVAGEGLKANVAGLANTVNWFSNTADLSGLAKTFDWGTRERTQTVYAATLSGDSGDLFKLPAGPIGFALGFEGRKEEGKFNYNPDLGQSFRTAADTRPPIPPFFKAQDVYAELRIPVLKDAAFAKELAIELAARQSAYEKSVGKDNDYGSSKFGLSWALNDSVRVRATSQSTIREPNFGEFANPVGSIPFANLVNVARLRPRYQGDPCALGTGNREQCDRFGAPAPGSYNSLDAANLTGGYFFGGNPDIRAEKGKSATLGLVLTPSAFKGLAVSLDFYDIRINDAVGVIQPVDALNSCYILNPTANNPLCAAVTRDPATGRIKDGFPVDRNLALIRQKGVDIDANYRTKVNAGFIGDLNLRYQAAVVRDYTIQRSPVVKAIQCKGTYGSTCSSDSVSLVQPAYRHRLAVANTYGPITAELGWKRIGEVKDSALGSTDKIAAQNYLDINLSYKPQSIKGLTVNFGINNLADKQAPVARNFGTFNTYPDTYDVVGRSYGVSVTYKFW
jgi:iron complex outermembrane recepter protein